MHGSIGTQKKETGGRNREFVTSFKAVSAVVPATLEL